MKHANVLGALRSLQLVWGHVRFCSISIQQGPQVDSCNQAGTLAALASLCSGSLCRIHPILITL